MVRRLYKYILIVGVLSLTSCNPMLYVYGKVLREHNISQNKYSKDNPYIEVEGEKKNKKKKLNE